MASSHFRKRSELIARSILALMLSNANAMTFLAGFGLAYTGIADWSRAAADLAAGLVLMFVGAWPYVRTRGERIQGAQHT